MEGIINFHHDHMERLILLLGVKELLNHTKHKNLEEFIETFEVNPIYLEWVIHALTQDGRFERHVEGELYQVLLDVQLMAGNIEPRKGSIGDFLKQSGLDEGIF